LFHFIFSKSWREASEHVVCQLETVLTLVWFLPSYCFWRILIEICHFLCGNEIYSWPSLSTSSASVLSTNCKSKISETGAGDITQW
jgi:hypothetical protein